MIAAIVEYVSQQIYFADSTLNLTEKRCSRYLIKSWT